MAFRPPGNPQSLLRRALSAIDSIVHSARDNLLKPGPLPLTLPPPSSTATSFATSPALQTLDHGGERGAARRGFSSNGGSIKATLFPGDGIGPEIAKSVKQVIAYSIFPKRTPLKLKPTQSNVSV
jgi:hypothetical protein